MMSVPVGDQSSNRVRPSLPWRRIDLAMAGLMGLTIVGVNVWLVSVADASWFLRLWVFGVIPIANAILGAVLLAWSAVIRHVTARAGLCTCE